ncbi:MAG: MATE family efflux transporter [Candidatus Nanohaloarchaea archaeon]
MRLRDLFKSREELDLVGGPIGKNLFYLSLPIVVINMLRTAYNIADTFWLGQLSDEALAAITFSFPIVFFLISLGMGISIAGSVLVAQFEGSGRKKMVDFAASQTIAFSVAASMLLGGVAYFFVGDFITLLGAEPAVQPLATGYMQVISLGLFFMFGFAVFISLLRGYGDTLTPMMLMLGSVVLNIILDPFLIFGWWIFPDMGVTGAAVATVFCRGLAMLAGLGILFSGRKGVQVSFSRMRPDLSFFRRMLAIGIPASLEITGRSVSVIAMIAIVGSFATTVVAGFGIGIRVFSLIFLPAIAAGRGVETMTGQNLGAGHFDRAEKVNYVAAKFMFGILTLMGVAIFLFPRPLVSLFTTNTTVVTHGAEFLRYVALTFGFIGVVRVFSGGFHGAGRTMVAAAISIVMMALVRVPVAYFLSGTSLKTIGIWISFPVSNAVGGLMAWLLFRTGMWRNRVVGEDREQGIIAEKLSEIGETITEAATGIRHRLPGPV